MNIGLGCKFTLDNPTLPLYTDSKALKRDSTHFGYYREKPVGARLYERNVEPVLELYTEHIRARLYWVRPLQRQSIDQKSVLIEAHHANYG